MRDLFLLIAHLLTTVARLLGPGGARAVVADSLLMKQQLLIMNAVVELKRRNSQFGCPRIAKQINQTFGTSINKDIVRRILIAHYLPDPGGPSWLTFLGHTKDSLWSIDLFRCESIRLRSHWVLVIMDQFTRRIIGFGVHQGDGVALCCLFNQAIASKGIPKYLSSDNDALFRYHRWQTNLRILEIEEIQSIPYTPTSHPFIERLIGTIRREFLDNLFFWNKLELERKLETFRQYYNQDRVHQSLNGQSPAIVSGDVEHQHAQLSQYFWQSHCKGLFQTPMAA